MYPKIGESAEPAADQPASENTENAAGETDNENAVGETALLPKTILAGKNFKPGDEVVLKVVHIYDDEVEVEYATEPTKPEPESEDTMSADQEIDRMSSMKEMA